MTIWLQLLLKILDLTKKSILRTYTTKLWTSQDARNRLEAAAAVATQIALTIRATDTTQGAKLAAPTKLHSHKTLRCPWLLKNILEVQNTALTVREVDI